MWSAVKINITFIDEYILVLNLSIETIQILLVSNASKFNQDIGCCTFY